MTITRLKSFTKVMISVFLFTVLLVAGQSGFSSGELHPAGLVVLHESIPGIQMAPKLYGVSAVSLPAAVDLSDKLPPIGDQGNTSSCVAWATGYGHKSYQEGLDWGWSLTTTDHQFSAQYIYSQIHATNWGDGGGAYFSDAFKLLQNQGCCSVADMPFINSQSGWQTEPNQQQKDAAAKHKAQSWSQLTSGDYNEVKAQLAAGNLVTIGIPIYPDFDNLDANNPIYDDTSGNQRGNHAILAVGYDDSKKAIKIMNSWGTSWGLSGWGWVSYNLYSSKSIEGYIMTDIADATTQPTPTPTSAVTPTPTSVVTPTPTQVATPTPTKVATPTPTKVATPTPTAIVTPIPTAIVTPIPTAIVTPTPKPTPGSGNYVVTYVVSGDWGGQAMVNVTITNNTNTNVDGGWTLAWSFPGNQTITMLWGGNYTQNGTAVSVQDFGWSTILANGGMASIGFNLNYSGTNANPTSFTLNGVPCQVQ